MTHSGQETEPHISTVIAKDLKMVAAAQAGSSTAFDELQRLYSHKLFATILRITRNREDAEDALQDTFLRAYLAFDYFERRSSVYTWLTRIAINSALMILRRRRAGTEVFDSSFGEGEGYPAMEIRDTAPDPEQLCALRQRRTSLLRAIRTLEPKLRAPIQLQLANEHSLKEIANTLNTSVPAVKARLRRARARLANKGISTNTGTKDHLPVSLVQMRFLEEA